VALHLSVHDCTLVVEIKFAFSFCSDVHSNFVYKSQLWNYCYRLQNILALKKKKTRIENYTYFSIKEVL
jgi:hypothetical protein